MMIDKDATIEITAFDWVPDFARGYVRDLRPRWACEELGLGYRERLISAVRRPEWYFGEQPWGQVPHLRDGDIHLFESGATLVHLAERAGRLLPAGGQGRADVLSWLFAAFNSVEPLLMELGTVTLFAAGEAWAEARKPGLLTAIGQKLDRLEAALGERDWIAGDFSIADIAMVSALRGGGPELLAGHARLAAYRDRGTARPAFQAALAAQLAALDIGEAA
ncbi:glutathione S-transferase family protein [Sphingomonas parva]|uniref:Glutathione S-transferase family protein n=1 Tax=Sphingomonas parva TaxID=2555898 RepID=A0A4Y8ZR81_9SPHN|nr:glutathione S-transferase family protein [Sphingomonas parva]TFI57792.1 glutathione S-transferase family protein [Sphingomonas parva]